MRLVVSLSLYVSLVSAHADSKFKDKFEWKTLRYDFSECPEKEAEFVPLNNVPTGLEVYKDKIFITIPRRYEGTPCTLAYVSTSDTDKSPTLKPFLSFKDQETTDCDNIISVNRGARVVNDLLYVFDFGKVGMGDTATQVCSPKILVFDLKTEKKLKSLELPDEVLSKKKPIYTDMVVDDCPSKDQTFIYLADEEGIIVCDLKSPSFWRVDSDTFTPEPKAHKISSSGVEFEWDGGVFDLTLGSSKDCVSDLFYHALPSFQLYKVSTSVLQNKDKIKDNQDGFKVVGSTEPFLHYTTLAYGLDQVLFFPLIDKAGVGCWDTKKPIREDTLEVVSQDEEKMTFLTDSAVDEDGKLWVMSNKWPVFLYHKEPSPSDVNFRIMSADMKDLVKDGVCDPNQRLID